MGIKERRPNEMYRFSANNFGCQVYIQVHQIDKDTMTAVFRILSIGTLSIN